MKNELPELKGFSERNLGRMLAFYREYPPEKQVFTDLPQAVVNLKANRIELGIVAQISWGHNLLLIEKIKELSSRLWFVQQTIHNCWSRDVLSLMIKSSLHLRQGDTINNFAERLPNPQSDLARQSLKDPYVFYLLPINQSFTERELEVELTRHIEKFLLELGTGFAFVGRQHYLAVSNHGYYLDLLFYHLHMRCFVVIELKKGSLNQNTRVK